MYTDTDCLLLEIKMHDVYKDIESCKNVYRTSEYPKEHPLYSNDDKKVLGKMKDECAGTTLESLSYTENILHLEGRRKKAIKRAKGVKKNFVKKQIMHEQCKETFFIAK